jgi:hypothetical protein
VAREQADLFDGDWHRVCRRAESAWTADNPPELSRLFFLLRVFLFLLLREMFFHREHD